MNAKNLRPFILAPIYLIGISTGILGLAWLFAPEPWLLDQNANEALLQLTYKQLFAADINRHLGDYLTGLYRFFGWWVFLIGLLILLYAFVTKLGTERERNYFYVVMFIAIAGLYVIQFQFIPGSPFLWSSHGFALMLLLSIAASIQLKKIESASKQLGEPRT